MLGDEHDQGGLAAAHPVEPVDMRLRHACVVALLVGTAARAELSPGEAALLSAGVTLAGAAAGTGIAVLGALKSDTWDPQGTSTGRIVVGSVIGGLALLFGPSMGRLATGTPARNLILFRGVVLAAGGLAALAIASQHDTTGASGTTAGVVVAPIAGIVLLSAAAYDIATTPADVDDARRIELRASSGGATLALRF